MPLPIGRSGPSRRLPRLDRLLVTRPEAEARRWAADLRAHGWPADVLPLLAITAPADADTLARLQHWRVHWPEVDAVFFVSAAAATHFWDSVPHGADAPLPKTRFWAPGPGTAKVVAQCLAQRGLGALSVDAPPAQAGQFDSEHLWPVVADQARPGRRLLVVRGASEDAEPTALSNGGVWPGAGRDWLLNRCRQAGMEVNVCVAYQRVAPRWSTAEQALAQAGLGEGSLWLLSSSEAVRHWERCWGGVVPSPSAGVAMVTHERIAVAAERLGFGRVVMVRPTLSDVLSSLESGWSPP